MSKNYIFLLLFILSAIGTYLISNSKEQPEYQNNSPASQSNNNDSNKDQAPSLKFSGEQGEKIELIDGKVKIKTEAVDDNQAHYYNVKMPNGKIIYFFVVKDKNGVYRSAANACKVCFDARQGFRQEEIYMVCNACGNKYPMEKIATEKGGCNPGPINSNLKPINGELIVSQAELEDVIDLF
ncbi:MAG: DUF2318 domain-containing protein [bacterium]